MSGTAGRLAHDYDDLLEPAMVPMTLIVAPRYEENPLWDDDNDLLADESLWRFSEMTATVEVIVVAPIVFIILVAVVAIVPIVPIIAIIPVIVIVPIIAIVTVIPAPVAEAGVTWHR